MDSRLSGCMCRQTGAVHRRREERKARRTEGSAFEGKQPLLSNTRPPRSKRPHATSFMRQRTKLQLHYKANCILQRSINRRPVLQFGQLLQLQILRQRINMNKNIGLSYNIVLYLHTLPRNVSGIVLKIQGDSVQSIEVFFAVLL